MTPSDLLAWRLRLPPIRRNKLSQADAAAIIGVSPRQYYSYETGEAPIPLTVELACRAVELDRGMQSS